MIAKIEKSVANGKITAPPSKSYAHRLMICAALAQGGSKVSGIIDSQDMLATLDCICALGVNYEKQDSVVTFFDHAKKAKKYKFYCRESGSTIRFFIPIALVFGAECEFYGTKRLLSRGFEVYEKICSEQGFEMTYHEDKIAFKGSLRSGTYNVRGDISSQFISGLLFALPLLEGNSVINITTELESASYVDMTVLALKQFGIDIKREGNTFYIDGGQAYKPNTVQVEADASNAAFLDAFNYIGGSVCVQGLNENSIQPDSVYKTYFEALSSGTPTLDISACPDLGPILLALAAVKNGATLTGTRRLRIKESDRASAMASELSKIGIKLEVNENSVIVNKGEINAPKEILYGHNDHRIVMALAVISTLFGAEIDGAEAVTKSYPEFFEDLKSLQVRYEVTYENNK